MDTVTRTIEPDLGAPATRRRRCVGLVQVYPATFDAPPCVWRISRNCSLGRGDDVDIDLRSDAVSRRHASIRLRNGQVWVSDEGSRNGTYVHGCRVERAPVQLEHGGVLRVGGTLLALVDDVASHECRPRYVPRDTLGLDTDIYGGALHAGTWDAAARAGTLRHPVLVTGETGSGKEIVARMIHAALPNKGPFVPVNVAAVPESLFEAELFGYRRGAFSGARYDHAGCFREAHGGVLFLDEVADLRPALQVKLLRAVETKRVRPLGTQSDVPVDVIVVAATNRDVAEACEEGTFRPDLYHRLSAVEIRVPSLAQCPVSVMVIASGLLRSLHPGAKLSVEAAEMLMLEAWPGNVRELRNALLHGVGRATLAGRTCVGLQDLPAPSPPTQRRSSSSRLKEAEIRHAIRRAGGVLSRACKDLGVCRATLYNNCRRLGLNPAMLREGCESR